MQIHQVRRAGIGKVRVDLLAVHVVLAMEAAYILLAFTRLRLGLDRVVIICARNITRCQKISITHNIITRKDSMNPRVKISTLETSAT